MGVARRTGGTFTARVHAACARIPRGKVATYRELARAIGAPRAARAVGNALNRNEDMAHVPCHRVVLGDGRIGGYALGSAKKAARLKKEGVLIKNGRVDLGRFGYRLK